MASGNETFDTGTYVARAWKPEADVAVVLSMRS
jgi:hypothetical protein